MIQILIRATKIFCAFGGPNFAPFIMPIIGPMCWVTLVLCVFLPIYFSSPSFLNSNINSDNKEKKAGRAFLSAFLIHYTICVILLCSIMQTTCKVSKYVP